MQKTYKSWFQPLIMLCLLTMLACSCKKDEGDKPVLTTSLISNITPTSATSGGNITSDGGSTVTDVDGNVYHTVTIGTQVWLVENLKVTSYRNSDPIPDVTDFIEWSQLTTGGYCNMSNEPANSAVYGRLYNWHAVNDIRNIAPVGWHVATDDDWTALVTYLGGEDVAGGKMKEESGKGIYPFKRLLFACIFCIFQIQV